MDWTEKYRPSSLSELVGNGPSIAKLKAWAEEWKAGMPDKRAIILAGPPGTGKTSAALALGHDMGWEIIELNASDARNADTIKRVATAGALHQGFGADGSFQTSSAGHHKLIVLDEADNLTERLTGENAAGGGSDLSDKGGKAQILATIRQSRQPIILIVNDLYALTKGSGAALKALADTLKFTKVNVRSIPKALGRIAQEEGIRVQHEVLQAIADKAEGDLRAAVRDLESICLGRTEVTVQDLASLGPRDTTANIFDVVRHILKGTQLSRLRREVMDVDATPEDMVMWVDENLAKEYKDPRDLVAGYEMLSKADRFLGRTRRTQNYRLWAYASDLATGGVMAVREREYRGFTPFGFPQYLSKMARSRGVRATNNLLAEHLGKATHCSKRKARLFMLEPFRALFAQDEEFAAIQTFEMEITDDEVAVLLGKKATAKEVKAIRAKVKEMEEAHGPKEVSIAFGGSDGKPKRKPKGEKTFDAFAEAKPANAEPAKAEPDAKADAKAAEEDDPSKATSADGAGSSGDGASSAAAEKPRKDGGQQKLF